ncbi:HPP family protein [Leucobacter sp. 1207-22]|uniref:HPP family protein n=1 Tax=Leucobacter sp. 1207-22 TaxID=2604456 RepID=UPI0040644A8A
MPASWKAALKTKTPPRPAFNKIIVAVLVAGIALCSLVAIGTLAGHQLLIPPLAASMVLIVTGPNLHLSQPRQVIGGHLLSALVGVGVGVVSHSLWAAAIAGALSLGVMLALRTAHSPGSATAMIAAMTVSGRISLILSTVIGAIILVLFGILLNKIKRTGYPAYWW